MLLKDKLGVWLLDFILWLYFEGLKSKRTGQIKFPSSLQVLPEFPHALGTFSRLHSPWKLVKLCQQLLLCFYSVCFMEKSFFSQLQGKGYLKTQHKFQAVHNKGHASTERVRVNIRQQLQQQPFRPSACRQKSKWRHFHTEKVFHSY